MNIVVVVLTTVTWSFKIRKKVTVLTLINFFKIFYKLCSFLAYTSLPGHFLAYTSLPGHFAWSLPYFLKCTYFLCVVRIQSCRVVLVTFDFLLYITYKIKFFQKNTLKLSLGRFLWNYLWADFYEIYLKTRRILWILFVYLMVIFVCMVFVFLWFKHKCWFFRFYFDIANLTSENKNHKKIKAI